MNANGRIAKGTNMSNQRRTSGRNMGHLLNIWTWSQAIDRECPPASAKGPNFGVSLPVPVCRHCPRALEHLPRVQVGGVGAYVSQRFLLSSSTQFTRLAPLLFYRFLLVHECLTVPDPAQDCHAASGAGPRPDCASRCGSGMRPPSRSRTAPASTAASAPPHPMASGEVGK